MSKVKTNLTSFFSHLEKSSKKQPEIVRKRITTGAKNVK